MLFWFKCIKKIHFHTDTQLEWEDTHELPERVSGTSQRSQDHILRTMELWDQLYGENVEEFWLCLSVDGKGDHKEDEVRDRGGTWPSEIFVGLF